MFGDRQMVAGLVGAVAEAARRQAGFGASIERYAGRVEALVDSLRRPDAVVVNPPRTGLAPEVNQVLIRHRPGRLVYVSCDPATLARDLRVLVAGGFRVADLAAWDLFPQTAHVETVAGLEGR